MIVLVAVVGALALVADVSPVIAFALIASLVAPWLTVLFTACWLIAIWIVRRRRSSSQPLESMFLADIASAMAAGSTLPNAIHSSASPLVDSGVRRLAELGADIDDVGAALEPNLPNVGAEFRVIAQVSSVAGTSVVAPVTILADHARDIEQQRRERRIAVAQARFSAIVVGVLPLVVAIATIALRGIPEPGGSAVIIPMVLGATLMVVGSATVFAMSRRLL